MYVKATDTLSLTTLLFQGVIISTAPAMRYPLPVEGLILPSLEMCAPLPLRFHRLSSIRGWCIFPNMPG